jgi:hypothetical protein
MWFHTMHQASAQRVRSGKQTETSAGITASGIRALSAQRIREPMGRTTAHNPSDGEIDDRTQVHGLPPAHQLLAF